MKKGIIILIYLLLNINNTNAQEYARVIDYYLVDKGTVEIKYIIRNSSPTKQYHIEMYWQVNNYNDFILPEDEVYDEKVVNGANNFRSVQGGNVIRYIQWRIDREIGDVMQLVANQTRSKNYNPYSKPIVLAIKIKNERGYARISQSLETRRIKFNEKRIKLRGRGRSTKRLEARWEKYKRKKKRKGVRYI